MQPLNHRTFGLIIVFLLLIVVFNANNNLRFSQIIPILHNWSWRIDFRVPQLHKSQMQCGRLTSRALLQSTSALTWSIEWLTLSCSHCHCHIIGQVIATGKDCITFVLRIYHHFSQKMSLKRGQFPGNFKNHFFGGPKLALLFAPHMGMYPVLLYFIPNLRVHTFTT